VRTSCAIVITRDTVIGSPQMGVRSGNENRVRMMSDADQFNAVGFLSPDLVGWAQRVRAEFSAGFDVADRFNRLGMRMLLDIPTENIDDAKAMATAAYGRAIQSFQSALLLAQIGALAESRTLVRLCAEAVILVGALKADPDMAKRMREDDAHHKRALANSLLEDKPDDERAAGLRAVLASVNERYPGRKPKSMNWDSAARTAGAKHLYDMVYRLHSGNAAHATLGALDRHLVPDEANQLSGFKYHPDKSDLNSTLFAANAAMAQLLGFMVEWFPLDKYHDELTACIAQWRETKAADYEWK
jgi:hypothetical protein